MHKDILTHISYIYLMWSGNGNKAQSQVTFTMGLSPVQQYSQAPLIGTLRGPWEVSVLSWLNLEKI